jgi:hypothetical protein
MFNGIYKVHLLRLTIFISTISLLTSCVFVPKESEKQLYAVNCNMFTRQLTLSPQEIKGHICNADDSAEACLMVYGIILPVSSFVISGSIVLIGNTIHWLEYQGPCNEGLA